MKPIPAVIVEATWKKVAHSSPIQANKLVGRLNREQPVILGYLQAIGEAPVGDDEFNPDEKELLFYLGIVVYEIMAKGGKLPKVTEEMINEAEDINFKMLDDLTDDFSEETIAGILQNYNQLEVLKYVIEALMEEPETDSGVRDEYIGIMMIYLKTVIDCLDG